MESIQYPEHWDEIDAVAFASFDDWYDDRFNRWMWETWGPKPKVLTFKVLAEKVADKIGGNLCARWSFQTTWVKDV